MNQPYSAEDYAETKKNTGVILLCLGIIMTLIGSAFFIALAVPHLLNSYPETASGQVVKASSGSFRTSGSKNASSDRSRYSCYAEVKFVVNDKVYLFEEKTSSERIESCPVKGDEVTVGYNPEDPSKAKIMGGKASTIIGLIMGSFFFFSGALLLYFNLAYLPVIKGFIKKLKPSEEQSTS